MNPKSSVGFLFLVQMLQPIFPRDLENCLLCSLEVSFCQNYQAGDEVFSFNFRFQFSIVAETQVNI